MGRHLLLNSARSERLSEFYSETTSSVEYYNWEKVYLPHSKQRVNWSVLSSWYLIIIIGFFECQFLCNQLGIDECEDFDAFEKVKELLNTLIFSTVIFYFGYVYYNYGEYEDQVVNKLKRWYYVPIVFLSILGFSFLSTLSFNHTSVTKKSFFSQWTLGSYLTYGIATIVVIGFIVRHLQLAWKVKDSSHSFCQLRYRYVYLLSIVAMIAFYFGCYLYLAVDRADFEVHIHHWFLFWFLALFAHFDDHVSVIGQAICVGIFIQGASSYGVDEEVFSGN